MSFSGDLDLPAWLRVGALRRPLSMEDFPTVARRARLIATLAVFVASVAGCSEEPGSELEVRECLWVYSVAVHGARFEGREVPLCASIDEGRDGVLRLSDMMKPQTRLILRFPESAHGDPGVARVRVAIAARAEGSRMPSMEGRYHGRVELRTESQNVFHVSRVDWLDGRPR